MSRRKTRTFQRDKNSPFLIFLRGELVKTQHILVINSFTFKLNIEIGWRFVDNFEKWISHPKLIGHNRFADVGEMELRECQFLWKRRVLPSVLTLEKWIWDVLLTTSRHMNLASKMIGHNRFADVGEMEVEECQFLLKRRVLPSVLTLEKWLWDVFSQLRDIWSSHPKWLDTMDLQMLQKWSFESVSFS